MAESRVRAAQGRFFAISAIGLLGAAIFFTASLTPSLIPRGAVAQGLLGGVVGMVGYELGRLALALWRFLELPEVPARHLARVRRGSFPVAAGIAAFGVMRAGHWQNITRKVMGVPASESDEILTLTLVAIAGFLTVWLVMRGFDFLFRRLDLFAGRWVPRRVGVFLAFVAAGILAISLINGVVVERLLSAANDSFAAADAMMEPNIPKPTDPAMSGSDGSLVRWEELGRRGRSFVATVPTQAEISAFTGTPALAPIRVYVGRGAAETPRERAEIALQELIRVGGFERSTLVVAVPVGTGWMDPGAHDSLEFMLGGDVATVAVAYSYLTSVLSLYVAPDEGVNQARELFDVVYAYWRTLPKDARPKFYVHGLSQGAFNSQATLPVLDMLDDPIQGAMWAGSPFFSPYWQFVRDRRTADSPIWRPRFGNGSLVRTANQEGGLDAGSAPWGPIRMVFLNYGSDAIVNFTPAVALRPPAWLAAPRAPDVAPELSWFPLVTMFQLAFDMAISLEVPGFGHFYIAPDYIDAWAAVLDPPGWSPARAAALKDVFEKRPPPF